MEIITTLLGQYAFPIAACVAMGWYVVHTGDQHKAEMDEMRQALENNTIALTKLADKLGEE